MPCFSKSTCKILKEKQPFYNLNTIIRDKLIKVYRCETRKL